MLWQNTYMLKFLKIPIIPTIDNIDNYLYLKLDKFLSYPLDNIDNYIYI